MRYALVGFLITLLVSGTMTLAAENGLESVDLSQLRDQHCEVLSMACNSTASDTLDSSDCTFRDATYFDIWEFEGTAGQTVVIDLISYSSDAVLFLADPNEQVVATDDDSGVGSNSRIVRVLESSGTWSIISNHLLFHSFGGYTLQLQCSNCAAEPPASPGPASTAVRLRARNADRYPGSSNWAGTTSSTTAACSPSAPTLCLPPDNRFELSVYYETTQGGGRAGDAQAIPLHPLDVDKGGIFAFQDPANPELLVKVLNGCTVNDHFWVFFAATTNVGFELTVTDTQAGETKVYTNPDVHPADTVTDTRAFATCPAPQTAPATRTISWWTRRSPPGARDRAQLLPSNSQWKISRSCSWRSSQS